MAKILNYDKLSLILNAQEGKEKELEKDVVMHYIDENNIGIRLYNTDVITLNRFNIYTLNMLFPSSKLLDTFLKYTPAKIVLKELKFYVLRQADGNAKKQNLVPLFNGIQIDSDGDLYSANIEDKVGCKV